MTEVDHAARARDILGRSRWWQLVAAAVMMALASPYQYVWSSIEGPLGESLGASEVALGVVFTTFVVVMTVTQFPAGWYRDRFGPQRLAALAGVLAGAGYVGTAFAGDIYQLFAAYALGSVGVGIVYTIAVNTAIKWFPDKAGLTTGVGTMAFGAGAALFIPVVRTFDGPDELPVVLTGLGVLIGIGIVAGSFVLRDPPAGWRSSEPEPDGGATIQAGDYHWRAMVRTWQFWVLYVMFVSVSAAGLMITARIVLFTEHLGLAAIAATVAATGLPIASGLGRLLVGWVSDYVRRELMMAGSFLACGVATLLLVGAGVAGVTVAYVVAVFIAVFFWSSQFSLFPSLVAEYYGTSFSSANYALVYSGKLWGGVFGGAVVGWLVASIGWEEAFVIGGGLAILAGLCGLVLRPPAGD